MAEQDLGQRRVRIGQVGIEGEGAVHEIYCAQDSFNVVREALEKSLGQPSVAKLSSTTTQR